MKTYSPVKEKARRTRYKTGVVQCRRCKIDFKKTTSSSICNVCKTRCVSCGELLTPDTIYTSVSYRERSKFICKECVRKGAKLHSIYNPTKDRYKHLKRNYGITNQEYEDMFIYQGGMCYICEHPPKEGKRLHVDHKHLLNEKQILREKGQALIRKNVRGLLCWKCNNLLGKARDNIKTLRRAAEYLENPPARKVLNDPF